MSAKNLSISQKLKKNPRQQTQLLNDWLDAWEREQLSLLKRLNRACHNDEQAYQALSALFAITNKKITAIKNILAILTNPSQDVGINP